MLGGWGRSVRALAVGCCLVVAAAACRVDVQLSTSVERDGSGLFSLKFVIDKELVDLARNSGEDPFEALNTFPEELTKTGWRFTRSTEGGGLSISVERPFRDPDDLNRALQQLERAAAEQQGPTARFFKFRVTRSSGFLRTRTAIDGTIDLSSGGLLGEAGLPKESVESLQTLIQQAASEFFTFSLRANLPGGVSSTKGDPGRVDGGTVEWSPRLGRTLSFRAESSAYNPSALGALGAPVVLLLLLVGLFVIRRGRSRRAAIAPPGPLDQMSAVEDPAPTNPLA